MKRKSKPAEPVAPVRTNYISIVKCPQHGFLAITLDAEAPDGGGHGTRLTNNKCCGSWDLVQKWPVDLKELIKTAESMQKS